MHTHKYMYIYDDNIHSDYSSIYISVYFNNCYSFYEFYHISAYLLISPSFCPYATPSVYVCIVDMIHVGNNNESQLEELLSRKERKLICDLGSITPYGLNQDDGSYSQNKRCTNQ